MLDRSVSRQKCACAKALACFKEGPPSAPGIAFTSTTVQGRWSSLVCVMLDCQLLTWTLAQSSYGTLPLSYMCWLLMALEAAVCSVTTDTLQLCTDDLST